MDKHHLVAQLCERLRASARQAEAAGAEATIEAREGATPAEKREDARSALEYGGLARGHIERARQRRADLATLESFNPPKLPPTARVSLGAIVEVEDEECGKTFFLAPSGAGEELTVPGGDGFLSAITPVSPLGRAMLGRRVGDELEVVVGGEPKVWRITFVG
jgi:transcription elongation GreA/GreB family factor